MDFISLLFLGFLVGFLIVFYLVPAKYRYIVIFVGSYIFYGMGHPIMLVVLAGVTVISYLGGLFIERKKSKTSFVIFFILIILVLVVFKYTNFVMENINKLASLVGFNVVINHEWDIILPIGLSFIVFQTCAYLSDVYKENISSEKNIIRYAAYVAFFPTVLSGPIQKARNLLPQIKNPKKFDYEQAQKGVILFVWGAFVKIYVANNLSIIVSRILNDYINHTSMELLIGACCFSLYIYADFSAYSDMARGIAKLLNIDVGKNFNNPYISKSTGEFWNRWHTSLNEWLRENIYIPLGGNRKGTARKYLNVLIVFFISGLWHGASWHFVAWGLINGILVVIGEIIRPAKQKLYKKIKINEEVESFIFIKRLVVFALITFTWLFFNSGVLDALRITKKIILFDFVSIFDPELLNIAGTATTTFIALLATVIFCIVQYKRRNEKEVFDKYKRQPFILQCLLMAFIICLCVFGACNTEILVDSQFIYFQF